MEALDSQHRQTIKC